MSEDAPTTSAEHSTCSWCPLCQGVNALRATNPETVDRLTDAVALLAEALADVAVHLRGRIPASDRHASSAPAGRHEDAQTAAQTRRTAYDIPVVGEEE